MGIGASLSITVELEDCVRESGHGVQLRRYSTGWENYAAESASAHNCSKGKSSPTSKVIQSDRGTWDKNEAYPSTHTESLEEEDLVWFHSLVRNEGGVYCMD